MTTATPRTANLNDCMSNAGTIQMVSLNSFEIRYTSYPDIYYVAVGY